MMVNALSTCVILDFIFFLVFPQHNSNNKQLKYRYAKVTERNFSQDDIPMASKKKKKSILLKLSTNQSSNTWPPVPMRMVVSKQGGVKAHKYCGQTTSCALWWECRIPLLLQGTCGTFPKMKNRISAWCSNSTFRHICKKLGDFAELLCSRSWRHFCNSCTCTRPA